MGSGEDPETLLTYLRLNRFRLFLFIALQDSEWKNILKCRNFKPRNSYKINVFNLTNIKQFEYLNFFSKYRHIYLELWNNNNMSNFFVEFALQKYNLSCESPVNNIANIPRNVTSKK